MHVLVEHQFTIFIFYCYSCKEGKGKSMHYDSYAEVLTSLKEKNRKIHLLLGNGFSMAYDSNIFSYNALYNFIASLNDKELQELFETIKTKNFELIMNQLDTFEALLVGFKANIDLIRRVQLAKSKLKQSLLDAISEMHPEHVFSVSEEKIKACSKYINDYIEFGGNVFTTNYDLLLYWVNMRGGLNGSDGFGRELLNPEAIKKGEEAEWSELIWGPNRESQNIYYVHGTLPIFDLGKEIIKEQYSNDAYLLENIMRRMDKSQYPIFVTAGNGDEKLEHIRHNRYLTFAYDKLSEIDGSLITFGFNFGDYDMHIIEAINRASKYKNSIGKLYSVYIGVYSDEDALRIKNIESKFVPKVHTYNAKTANVWS
jgi:Domain of unknown function (DUF4917)